MRERISLRRRAFLRNLGTGAASALGLALFLPASVSCLGERDPLVRVLSRFFDDPEGAAVVGSDYLARAAQEADLERLLRQLTRDRVDSFRGLAASDPDALCERIRAQHRDDFERDRVTTVRGWVLSLTEARLCALAAIA